MKGLLATDARADALRDFTADKRLLVLAALALVTGGLGAASAWALLKLIALFTQLAYLHTFSSAPYHLARLRLGPLSILVPVAGGVIVGCMARFGSQKIRGHGIPEALESILLAGSRIEAKVAVLKPLSSAIAIGTGGPFGAEGPIIMTGGALGSLFAQCFKLTAVERKTLLVAGAAAGMTGIFGTPVAAVLLAVEGLLFEWKPRSLVPVTVAALVAAMCRPGLVGPWPLFPHAGAPPMPWWGLALCAVIGITAGLQSAAMSYALYAVEDLYAKLPLHWMWWPALGGIVVGCGGWYDPAVLGVGYANIRALMGAAMSVRAAAALLVGKAVVWIFALASGTSGGVLAPLLMLGGALGALEAHLLPFGDPGFWALVAMSAVLGGALRTPLAATIFGIEITGDLRVMPALLAACGASYATTVLIMKRSILTERIARRGQHLSYEYGVDPFGVMRVREIMTSPVVSLSAGQSLAAASADIQAAGRDAGHERYPVVDPARRVIGVLACATVLSWARDGDASTTSLGDRVPGVPELVGYPDEIVGALADRMARAAVGCAPIVERASGQLVGIVTRRDLLRVRALAANPERERQRTIWFHRR